MKGMIPRHCADVGILQTNVPLTEESLRREFLHQKSYARTKFYAVNNGSDWAVVQVFKRPSKNLMQTIDSIKILSLPDRTRFLHMPDLDVLQIGQLLRMQAKHPKDLLIIQGRFDHVSFVDVRLPARIAVVDVVPPRPSKLLSAIKNMLGDSASALEIEVTLIDIEKIADSSKAERLMLPCQSTYSDLLRRTTKQIHFLDTAPALTEKNSRGIELIGCSLSRRIFEELYGFEPSFLSICPREPIWRKHDELPTISRCCKVKSGVEVDGKWIMIPWGADICEIGEAVRVALSL